MSASELGAIERKIKLASPVQRRFEFKLLRGRMLRTLIPCPGAADYDSLLAILRDELSRGTPAPVPEWYEFSRVNFGPRRIGYYACDARGCFFTEDPHHQVLKCAGYNLAKYCSKECQAADWKARHKVVCQKDRGASVKRVEEVCKILDRLAASGVSRRGERGRARTRRGGAANATRQQLEELFDPDSGDDADDRAFGDDWYPTMQPGRPAALERSEDTSFIQWVKSQRMILGVALAAFILIVMAAVKEYYSAPSHGV